jgi:hypothetical protein
MAIRPDAGDCGHNQQAEDLVVHPLGASAGAGDEVPALVVQSVAKAALQQR